MADALLEELLDRPDLPALTRQIELTLSDEAIRRQAFVDRLVDGDRHEFINGEVVMASPQRFVHGVAIKRLRRLMEDHVEARDLGFVGADNFMVRLTRNDYHPDVCFWRKEIADRFEAEQTIFPAPDLVVEVLSDSTAARDRGVKLRDYEAHGVREYWIVDADAQVIEQHVLDANGRYELRRKLDAGALPSEAIDGFTLDVAAVFRR